MSIELERRQAHIAFTETISALILSFAAYQEWCKRGAHESDQAREMIEHLLRNAKTMATILEEKREEMGRAGVLLSRRASAGCINPRASSLQTAEPRQLVPG